MACWCRKDTANNANCGATSSKVCSIKIIDPDFTQPCRGSEADSEYYTYSISGYDPCHWVDLNQQLSVTYTLDCYNESYQVIKEWWGISYDAVTIASTDFSAIIEDPNNNLLLSSSTNFAIQFRLLNWRWMSEYVSFTSHVLSMDQLYGAENATVIIDFSKIPSDKIADYTVGGRIHMYIETTTFNDFDIQSYGFFFELKGYEEPTKSVDILRYVIIALICLLVL